MKRKYKVVVDAVGYIRILIVTNGVLTEEAYRQDEVTPATLERFRRLASGND